MQRVRFVGRGARLPCSGRQHSGSMPTRLPPPGRGRRVQEGGDIQIPTTDSCWWMAETNTLLQSNYLSIKNKQEKKSKKLSISVLLGVRKASFADMIDYSMAIGDWTQSRGGTDSFSSLILVGFPDNQHLHCLATSGLYKSHLINITKGNLPFSAFKKLHGLLSHLKEWNNAICSNRDGVWFTCSVVSNSLWPHGL